MPRVSCTYNALFSFEIEKKEGGKERGKRKEEKEGGRRRKEGKRERKKSPNLR